ncbi:type II secretion system minor pseudopilin GspJ [Paraneptunicella aestuarii]|uniref:type II secretion system minor pseudopilin GspJ n=1 Tax=Paraneptunicella aestuarii TaxID=2831148 RepID=UPI001E5F1203|nr:type II secretion system minor pseudopilin GspJ [Paraneptunicella aestuarii]UAA38909.1 type II secretion system minor pseudopilin GspJ [Paraneptunicella aestuarii]
MYRKPTSVYSRSLRQKGFTLLEIMVAMAIFTLIGLASNSVLTTTLDSDALSQERFNQLKKLQRVMITIERDILQASQRPIRVEGEKNEIVLRGGLNAFESDADGVGFVRAGWDNPQMMLPRSNLQPVVYRLRDNKLEKLYSNYVDNVVGTEPKIKVLMEDIEDFQVEFYAGGRSTADDDLQWAEVYAGTTLPKAIAIAITSKEFGTIRREFLLATGTGGNSE